MADGAVYFLFFVCLSHTSHSRLTRARELAPGKNIKEKRGCLLTILVYSFEKTFQKVKGRKYKPGYPHILENKEILGECKVYREEEAFEVTI